MTDTLQNEIRAGLGISSWDESIDAVQTTVANALRRLDRRVHIRGTGYFNHSFVPDFTLTWPGAESAARDVFLRLGMSPEALLDDLTTLQTTEPILLDVGESIAETQARALDAVIEDRDTLVVDPAAVAALEPRRMERYADLLPSTMLKGGRGAVGGADARSLKDSAKTFFDAAETHHRQDVEERARELLARLSAAASYRLAQLGRVVWEASGGDPGRYPLTDPDTGIVDDDGLILAAKRGSARDPAFWRSVGSHLTFDRLVRLDAMQQRGLRYLVAANIDRLRAGALAVRPYEAEPEIRPKQARRPRPNELSVWDPRWSISDGALRYHGTNFIVYVATERDQLPDAPHSDNDQPLLADLVARLGVLPLASVSASKPDGQSVTVASAAHLDVLADATLRTIVDGPTVVESVGIRVGGSSMVTCSFADRSAVGLEGVTFDLAHLLRAALPVLLELPQADIDEMRRMAAYNARAAPGASSAEDDLGPW